MIIRDDVTIWIDDNPRANAPRSADSTGAATVSFLYSAITSNDDFNYGGRDLLGEALKIPAQLLSSLRTPFRYCVTET